MDPPLALNLRTRQHPFPVRLSALVHQAFPYQTAYICFPRRLQMMVRSALMVIRSLSQIFRLQQTRTLHFATHFGVVRAYIDTVSLDRCYMLRLSCLIDALRCPFATLYCPFAALIAASVRPWVRARFVTPQSSCATAIGNSLTCRIGIGIRRKDLL